MINLLLLAYAKYS